ncbi:MAG: LysR family transcriptional regulator, partial [Burkholderiaceae bacterium]
MHHNHHQSAANLSLKQLNYLTTLALTLNFTHAAKACFVTQSTLSGGIQELEKYLGVQLVERNNKHVMLTPIGVD